MRYRFGAAIVHTGLLGLGSVGSLGPTLALARPLVLRIARQERVSSALSEGGDAVGRRVTSSRGRGPGPVQPKALLQGREHTSSLPPRKQKGASS
jgi:hypothetical protein